MFVSRAEGTRRAITHHKLSYCALRQKIPFFRVQKMHRGSKVHGLSPSPNSTLYAFFLLRTAIKQREPTATVTARARERAKGSFNFPKRLLSSFLAQKCSYVLREKSSSANWYKRFLPLASNSGYFCEQEPSFFVLFITTTPPVNSDGEKRSNERLQLGEQIARKFRARVIAPSCRICALRRV